MKNKQILGALAMDLKRVALGLHRGSTTMAQRFEKEAGMRMEEVERKDLLPYMNTILIKIHSTFSTKDIEKKADDILMYSTIVQNYVLYK
jgi:hypothetical protein